MIPKPTTVVALLAAAAFPSLAPQGAGVDPGSQLVPCDQAETRVTIDVSSHLDPTCTWTRGVRIVASDVTLDCQGARISAPDRRYGVYIVAPTDVALSNVTVRNCHVEGFLNNFHIEREGFRELSEGIEYEHAFSNITIEDSTSQASRGVGVFVNGYVTGVTLRNLLVEGSGSAGIYLETGSRDNVVEDSMIVDNGFSENAPAGEFFEIGGVSVWFWGTGREGLAVDGSRFNRISNNYFSGNAAGSVFLYKNCGEFVNSRPERWFDRRYGADGNVIEGNSFVGGRTGVWIGSRMSENTAPMECSDAEYASGYRLDYAPDTVVRGNAFENVTFGVRIEDDRAVVEDNDFTSDDPAHVAVVLGTERRTEVLGRPVSGASITGNRAFIAEDASPYRWIHAHAHTTFEGNESLGRPAGLCQGVQPARGPFVFVVDFVIVPDGGSPPAVEPPVLPDPEPLPPCPVSCERGGAVEKAKLRVRGLQTPPGDDALSFEGFVALPYPFAPELDPAAVGVAIVVADANGAPVVDTWVPGGAFDRTTGVGWKTSRRGTRWKYVDRGDDPPGGIVRVVIKDLSRRRPGVLRVSVKGKRGSYAFDPAKLPPTGLIVLDPPTAETGQCGVAAFANSVRGCGITRKRLMCR